MAKGNIDSRDWKNCIYCQRVEYKKKRRHFAMASLCQVTESHCNGCVTFKKAVRKNFVNKLQWLCSFYKSCL